MSEIDDSFLAVEPASEADTAPVAVDAAPEISAVELARLEEQAQLTDVPVNRVVDQVTRQHMEDVKQVARNEEIKREFYEKVMAARQQAEAPPPAPQPVPTAIMEQTKREMAEGQRMNEHHRKIQENRPKVVRSKAEIAAEGTSVPVFRPEQYTTERGNPSKGASTAQAPIR
jgi:hypothetical protein